MKPDWDALGVRPVDMLLPKPPYLNSRWPVVALDQYTSQPEEWLAAEGEIGEHPSTLRLVVPEAFLKDAEVRSQQVHQAMADYLSEDIFTPLEEGFVLVERLTQSGPRVGLVLAIDLEAYDYQPDSRSLIRATEETVLERIPPRLLIRERSALELSHVLLLIDDPEDSLLGPLYARREALKKLYDMPLLMGGGHIRGWQVREGLELAHALTRLKEKLPPDGLFLAVGDGNHSLAAAKASWEKQKKGLSAKERQRHPARFALAELINLHSPALLFEPIHRIAFDANLDRMMDILAPLKPRRANQAPDITLVTGEGDMPLMLSTHQDSLVAGEVQKLLDKAGLSLDYVHGEKALRDIRAASGGTGILMPDFPKNQLFPMVQRHGRLPRKTFSMGEANEKRFYMELRRLRSGQLFKNSC
ncbi:MAG: DUF1015 domain-containing protein [Christensenellales bacterium]|jgi:hypothetical protein